MIFPILSMKSKSNLNAMRSDLLPRIIEYANANLFTDVSSHGKVTYRCPFHEDDTPSLAINKKTYHYKCFACGAYGDYFDLRAKIENKSLNELIIELLRTWTKKPEMPLKPVPASPQKMPEKPFVLPETHRDFTKIHPASAEYMKKKHIKVADLGNSVMLDKNGFLLVISSNHRCAQQISTNGKYNIKGSRVRDAYHIVGSKKRSKGYALCEGFATALAVHKYSFFTGVFCFGFENIKNIAEAFKDEKFICLPDKDKNMADLPNKVEYPEDFPGSDWSDAALKDPENVSFYLSSLTVKGNKMNELIEWEQATQTQRAEVVTDIDAFLSKPKCEVDVSTLVNGVLYPTRDHLLVKRKLVKDPDTGEQIPYPPTSSFIKGNYFMALITDLEDTPLAVILREVNSDFKYTLHLGGGKKEMQNRYNDLYIIMRTKGILTQMRVPSFETMMSQLPYSMLPRFAYNDQGGWQDLGRSAVYWVSKDQYIGMEKALPYGERAQGIPLPDWARDLLENNKNPFFFFLFCHIGYYAYKKYQSFLKGKAYHGGHIVHIVGGTGTGKTTVCALWDRLLGNDQFRQLDNTEMNIGQLLEENEELFLDETESIGRDFDRFVHKVIYQVSAGATRGRFNRKSKYFAATMVSTGERALVTEASQAGTQRRVIQLHSKEIMSKEDCAKYLEQSTVGSVKETIVEAIPTLEVQSVEWDHKGLHRDLVTKVNEVISFGKAVCEQVFCIPIRKSMFEGLNNIFLVQDDGELPEEYHLTPEERRILKLIAEVFIKNRKKFPTRTEYRNANFIDNLRARHTEGFIDDDYDGDIIYIKSELLSDIKTNIGKSIYYERMITMTEKGIFVKGLTRNEKGGNTFPKFKYPRDAGAARGIGIRESVLERFM